MGKNGLTGAEVVGWLRDMCFDYKSGSEEEKALMAAADALESVTIVKVCHAVGYADVDKINPLLDCEIVEFVEQPDTEGNTA